MRLEKYHGLGNDFLVLLDFDGTQPVDADLARAVCDRHRGVGADGLIRATVPSDTDEVDVVMELWNADGSRAETSGNGLRCLARAAVDAGLVGGPELVIGTDAGPRRATVGEAGMVSVEMGAVRMVDPSGQLSDLGPDDSRWSGFVDAGNPHVVFGVDDVDKVDVEQDGRAWDHHYPGGINVEYVVTGPGADELTMRVWERGVGETLACGTGACAAVVVAHRQSLVGERVTVHQRGGDAIVDLTAGTTVLTGPAEHICSVVVHGPGRGWGPASGRRVGMGPHPGEDI